MKKALAILTILALVAVTATAEITLGAWGRGLFVPVSNDGVNDSISAMGASWGFPGSPRIGFTVKGDSDNVGFQIDLNADSAFGPQIKTDSNLDDVEVGNYLGFGDQAKIWVKPVDMVTVSLGKVQDDTLRGNGAFGAFNWVRGKAFGLGEDFTFTRLQTYRPGWAGGINYGGVIVAVKPSDALYAGVCLVDVAALTSDLTKTAQYAAGYTIAGIGQVRAQYIAVYDGVKETDGEIQAAFKLTAVENLYADFGVSMKTNNKTDAQETKKISAYAKYSMDALTVHGLTQVVLSKDIDMAYTVGAGVDYSLAGGLGLFGDLRYQNDIAANSAGDTRIGFATGVTKGFSNGLIGIGLEVEAATDTAYMIPVRFEYWF